MPFPNVYLAGQDLTDPAAGVHCQPISTETAIRDAAKGLQILIRLAELVP